MFPRTHPINKSSQPSTGPLDPVTDKKRLVAKYGDAGRQRLRVAPLRRSQLDDATFWNEVRAYAKIPNTSRERYDGQYVAVYNGDIVDHDVEEATLAERFYRTFGYVPVLIHKVGVEDSVIDDLE